MLFKQIDEQVSVPEYVGQIRLLPILASDARVHQKAIQICIVSESGEFGGLADWAQ
jgi:hypothetical protein